MTGFEGNMRFFGPENQAVGLGNGSDKAHFAGQLQPYLFFLIIKQFKVYSFIF